MKLIGIWRSALWIGLAVGGTLTFAGLLTPFDPAFDIANQLRLVILAGFAALLGFSYFANSRWLLAAVALGFAGNAVLAAAPIATSAATGHAGNSSRLKIMSINVYYDNDAYGKIADAITAGDPDVIVFSEFERHHEQALQPALAARYPYATSCHTVRAHCDIGIYSKRRLLGPAESTAYTKSTPSLLTVRTETPGGGSLRIIGVHINYPGNAPKQVIDIDWLIARRNIWDGPLVLAGDLNLTPWAALLSRFQSATGLVRHGTFQRSWPVEGFVPNIPFVLIDNVLTTPDIKAVSFATGQPAGSDHLPVIATIALP
ncbi:MAG: endonuclease/exonuclease/phosphatase family protein [Hyphomicrobium sp.]